MKVTLSKGTITIETLDDQLLETTVAKVADLVTHANTIDNEVAAVGADIGSLKATVQALQDQIANGGFISESDLDPIVARMTDQEQALAAVHSAATTP